MLWGSAPTSQGWGVLMLSMPLYPPSTKPGPYSGLALPRHLTTILGFAMGSNRLAVLMFSIQKTGADGLMHIVEHRILQKKSRNE